MYINLTTDIVNIRQWNTFYTELLLVTGSQELENFWFFGPVWESTHPNVSNIC